MRLPETRIIGLIIKDIRKEADPAEQAALAEWLDADPEHRAQYERIRNDRLLLEGVLTHRRALGRRKQVRKRTLDGLGYLGKRRIRKLLYRLVAACVVLAVTGGIFWAASRRHEQAAAFAKNTLAPGRDRATLILADRREVLLDATRQGDIVRQGNTNVSKIDSAVLAYSTRPIDHKQDGKPEEVQYNSVITPRGGQYKLRLSDGTTVFLNAQSSLRFPVSFDGVERRVVLEGEGYFQVANDAARPFKVDLGSGKEITVLGTRFDVKAYADDPLSSATLLEGKIQVGSQGKTAVLEVDDRASIEKDGEVRVENDQRAVESIAWTRGLFRFQNASLRDVMRQLSRWYDVDIELGQAVPDIPITASISRNTSAWEVLDALKDVAGLKYSINGKKIIVLR